jgi:bifunctional UDP-N-acetylglucosamine pyrophosphorylase/glucosamine-1-phosphate N-acetyltransferase
MQVVILAAGEGIRMRPLTLDTPKPLLKVAGKSFLDRLFEAFPDEIDEAIIVVRYLADKIKEHCGQEFYGRRVTYAEGSSLGNAHSFLAARPHLHDERFMFVQGDEFLDKEDFGSCLKYPLSVLCFELPDPWNHGVATLREDGSLAEIIEKPAHPAGNLVVNGLMILNQKIFQYEPLKNANGEFYFTSLLGQFIKDEKVMAVKAKRSFGGISTPADIKRVEKLL